MFKYPSQYKTNSLQREIEAIKAEDPEETPAPQRRKRGSDAEPISGRAYKTSRTSSGAVVVDLTDD
jgi:hypothetical protein